MSNITNLNRDYLIKINVKEATIDVPKMTFWNTDKKTSNMFVQLVINMSTNELISQYVTVQNATDYKITLNVIKPKTKQYKTIEATLLNEEKALFEIDLPDEFTDQVGDYSFEFEVSSKVDSNDESITTSNGIYKVNGSILTNLNEETSSSPDLPILKQLIEQVKSLQGGDLTGYQKKNDAAQKTIVEDGKLYLTKSDGTKLDNGTALPTGSGTSIDDTNTTTDKTWSSSKIDSQFKDIANKVDEIVITGGGLSTTEKNLILTLFKNATYSVDMSNTVNTLETLFNGENIDSDTYTIINNLTNVSTSNAATSINRGSSYTAILTPNEGYTLGAIIVTMGGIDVTSSVVSNNTIEISNVTGNIVITASNAQSSSESTNWTNGVPYTITPIDGEYIDKDNGKLIQYAGWARTDYLGCYGASKVKIVWGRASTYGAFYDTNKKFINNFNSCTNQDESSASTSVLNVPKDASYFIASNSTSAMANCTITPYA